MCGYLSLYNTEKLIANPNLGSLLVTIVCLKSKQLLLFIHCIIFCLLVFYFNFFRNDNEERWLQAGKMVWTQPSFQKLKRRGKNNSGGLFVLLYIFVAVTQTQLKLHKIIWSVELLWAVSMVTSWGKGNGKILLDCKRFILKSVAWPLNREKSFVNFFLLI